MFNIIGCPVQKETELGPTSQMVIVVCLPGEISISALQYNQRRRTQLDISTRLVSVGLWGPHGMMVKAEWWETVNWKRCLMGVGESLDLPLAIHFIYVMHSVLCEYKDNM